MVDPRVCGRPVWETPKGREHGVDPRVRGRRSEVLRETSLQKVDPRVRVDLQSSGGDNLADVRSISRSAG